MKRFLALLLGCVGSFALAQTVLTIPAQTVTVKIPAQSVTVTIPAQTVTVPVPVVTPPVITPPVNTPVVGGLTITGQGANSISLAWPAVDGSTYRIYRNGVFYAISATNVYTDNAATNATNSNYNGPATIYSYAVSAVTNGVEGNLTSGATYWVVHQGVMPWQQYSYGLGTSLGANGLTVTTNSTGSGFQPYASGNVPQYDLEAGSFTYMLLDVQPTLANQQFQISFHSRVVQPPGDVYSTQLLTLENYCLYDLTKKVTCKIPLADFHIGKTAFVGSISGNTMTVTQADKNLIDRGGFVTGPGVAPGTWISDAPSTGGPGIYTVSPAQNVASATLSYQRTHLYKFDIIDRQGSTVNKYYLDNVGFQ